MPKWEYCRLTAFSRPYQLTVFGSNGARVFNVQRDKTKGDNNDDDAYDRMIAQLGLDGWEALGYQGQTGNILFKRQIP